MGKVEQAWGQAAACERHARETSDKRLKIAFRKMRDSWIERGNCAQLAEDVDANDAHMNSEHPD